MASRSILKRSDERSLLVIVLDVSPVVWQIRQRQREGSDKARLEKSKPTIGPATLEECLKSVQAFCGAFCGLQRDCALQILGVAGNETAVLFPRKDALHEFFQGGGTGASQLDIRPLQEQLVSGVAELVARSKASEETAAMAAGLSIALCNVNRFLVANGGGVSAVPSDSSALFRKDDEGVVSLMSGGASKKRKTGKAGAWSSRILIVQASDDRSQDYNAFMNCAFAAMKHSVVLDGCFIPSNNAKTDQANSSFLEQACDRAEGVYLAPNKRAQVGAALTEILFSIFLAPRASRSSLNLPAIHKVDFRARCFDTGATVSMAHVCNQCLSIFQNCPKDFCPTCGADIIPKGSAGAGKEQTAE
jgi:transcription initiation factor TFIIH subunit 3